MLLILVVLCLVLLLGALPPLGLHPYGAYPSSILGVVLVLLLVWFLVGGRL
jgi:hypothetical protein